MPSHFEEFRPRLRPRVRIRVRRDGTAGVHDPVHGRSTEIAADQATLLALLDGQRTLAQLAEAHYAAHRFVPFNALRDLLRTLANKGLLDNDPESLRRAGLLEPTSLMHRAPSAVAGLRVPGAGAMSVLFAGVWLGVAALWALTRTLPALTPYDVLWAFVGACLALSVREWFRASVATFGGAGPERLFLWVRVGLPSIAPDGAGIVLLDRRARGWAHVAALVGIASVMAAGTWSRGLAFGAMIVLAIDLCPFAPTSAGRLLATLAGRVDLREHARAYLTRRFLKRVGTTSTFEGEGSLILSALLSLAWLGLATRLLLTRGIVWVVELLALGVDASLPEKVLAYGGAVALVIAMPVFLLSLLVALWRALRALLPSGQKAASPQIAAADRAQLADIPLFSRLAAAEQQALASASEHRTYGANAEIVRQGEPGECFFAIRSGEVSVELEAPSGLRVEVARLGPGDAFGETALLEREPRTATVRALRETEVVALHREAFERVRTGLEAEEVTAILRATATLRTSPLFQRLSSDRLSALALRLEPRRVKAGEAVVREGEAGQEFFLVSEGTAEVLDADGRHIAELSRGDHFGEIALLRDTPRVATVRAKSDLLLLSLDKRTFLSAMAADLALSTELETIAAERAEAA